MCERIPRVRVSRKKSPPDVPGGKCRHAVLAAALAGAVRTGSLSLTYGLVQTVSIGREWFAFRVSRELQVRCEAT